MNVEERARAERGTSSVTPLVAVGGDRDRQPGHL
jgi:hypothetical protein